MASGTSAWASKLASSPRAKLTAHELPAFYDVNGSRLSLPLSESTLRTITGPRAHAILLANVGHDLHVDFAESLVGIRRRIIRDGVAVAEILADRLECFHLLL